MLIIINVAMHSFITFLKLGLIIFTFNLVFAVKYDQDMFLTCFVRFRHKICDMREKNNIMLFLSIYNFLFFGGW